MDIDAKVSLQVLPNKTVQMTVNELQITGFNVTQDNCGAKRDEAGIMTRLNGVMVAVRESVNALVHALAPRLPEFQTFSYSVAFDYQDEAFGTGILITPK
jgi:hypothetical protein